MKTKRKDAFEDDFADFSLSSPATKIRRLDAELPPIMEENEAAIPLDEEELALPVVAEPEIEIEIEIEEAGAPLPVNKERALVLYKPVHKLPSGVSVTLNQDLISGFRNDVFWYGRSDQLKPAEDQPDFEEKNRISNNCLAVVPWVSNQHHYLEAPTVAEISEPMEAEDVEVGAMEIEDDSGMSMSQEPAGMVNGAADVLQPWQQQHCMTSLPPPTTAATPVMWSL